MIDVLESARFVSSRSEDVVIDEPALFRLAERLLAAPIPKWDFTHHYYHGSVRTLAYLLLVDTLNFCFFPAPLWEVIVDGERLQGYFALTSVLKQAFVQGLPLDDFGYLARVEEETVQTLLHGAVRIGEIPLFEDRVRILRELGERMVRLYRGDPARLVVKANGSALRLVESVVEDFPSFRDEASYAGERVAFYKRAQIFAGDLFGSFQGRSFGAFRDIERLTAFADYKLPQILRAEGVLQYSEQLAHRVDNREWIEAGSSVEVEIRAATIWAVERLRGELSRRGRNLLAIKLDWILWNAAQRRKMAPHHRTLTIYY